MADRISRDSCPNAKVSAVQPAPPALPPPIKEPLKQSNELQTIRRLREVGCAVGSEVDKGEEEDRKRGEEEGEKVEEGVAG